MSEVTNRMVAVADCRPHPQNYNRHDEAQVADLRLSLRKFSQVRSIVVQDDAAGGFLLVAGHGLWTAARAEGFAELRADVIPASWPPAKVLAYLAADNELGRASDPDEEQLAALAEMLQADDADLARLAAGSEERLTELLAIADATAGAGADGATGETDPASDEAEALLEKWGVREGDIWRIGEQLVICSDCRDAATWERLFAVAGVAQAQLAVTSPPYAEQRKSVYGGVAVEQYVDWWEAVQAQVREHLAVDGSFCVNIKAHCEGGERVLYVYDLVLAMARRWGWYHLDEIVWQKTGLPGGWKNRLRNDFEPVHVFTPDGASSFFLEVMEEGAPEGEGSPFFDEAGSVFHFAGRTKIKFRPRAVGTPSKRIRVYSRANGLQDSVTGNIKTGGRYRRGIARPGNVLQVRVNQEALPHAAMFPVGLPAFFIRLCTERGDVVVDPFCGAGSTLVAAQNLGRRGLGIEVLPRHVAVTLERLAGLGWQPVLEERCEAGEEAGEQQNDPGPAGPVVLGAVEAEVVE